MSEPTELATAERPAADRVDPLPVLVRAQGLRKSYENFEAVKGLDFEVKAGEAFGFLGPNGAGKSSTMRMIACVSPLTEGRLDILGLDAATAGPQIRARLGVVPQDDTLDQELTVRENLLIYGRYFDLGRAEVRARADELLDFARLTEKADERVERLSGGMRRRLTIARALINTPDIVLLDEPTTGLDPQARHLLWERLYRLKREGVTLVLTTHYMDEAEQLCDRLVVMDGGLIVAEGSPRDLIARYTTKDVVEIRPDREGVLGSVAESAIEKLDGLADRIEALPDRVLVYTADGDETADVLNGHGVHAHRVLVRRSTLEDVFLHLTGRTLVD